MAAGSLLAASGSSTTSLTAVAVGGASAVLAGVGSVTTSFMAALLVAVDNHDGTDTFSGFTLTDNGDGTVTFAPGIVVDNGDGTATISY